MTAEQLEHQHTFDGIHASETGNTFQFCDITDPLLAKVLATDNIRSTCAPTFQGWYHVGTWAKATVILKDKMNTIIGGEIPDDSLYQRVCQWPELWDDTEVYNTYKDEVNDREVHEAKRHEHEIMHNVRIAARNPRYAFEKLEKKDITTNTAEKNAIELSDDAEIPEDLTEYPDNPDTAEVSSDEAAKTLESSDSEDDNDDEDGSYEEEDAEEEDENREFPADEDEAWDEDDDDEDGAVSKSARAVSEGPTPFGGLYNV